MKRGEVASTLSVVAGALVVLVGCSSSGSVQPAGSVVASATSSLKADCALVQEVLDNANDQYEKALERLKSSNDRLPTQCPKSSSPEAFGCSFQMSLRKTPEELRTQAFDEGLPTVLREFGETWPRISDPELRSVVRDASKDEDFTANLAAMDGFCEIKP